MFSVRTGLETIRWLFGLTLATYGAAVGVLHILGQDSKNVSTLRIDAFNVRACSA